MKRLKEECLLLHALNCIQLFFKSKDRQSFFIFYLPYVSSINEKANCIAIFWTGGPQSLESCHFRGVWTTCLPRKSVGVPLSVLPKDTTSELAACSPQPSLNAERREGKLWIPFFEVFWHDSKKGLCGGLVGSFDYLLLLVRNQNYQRSIRATCTV